MEGLLIFSSEFVLTKLRCSVVEEEEFELLAGRSEVTGGGKSSPSAAFRDSCRAKSEACHHSKNLRAKMDVGRRILREVRRRGYTV